MAKNWTLKEAVNVVTAGENKEAIQEIGKRFPLTTVAIAKIGKNEGVEALMSVMPDHVTMLKLERAFKEGVEESDVDEDEEIEATEEAEETGDQDLSEMTSKQLYALCVKRGIKAKKYGVNKQYYLELLNSDGEADEEAEEAEEAEAEEEAADEVDYESMKAPELYSLCKKRGIKVQPKQKAAVYIKALKAADAEVEEDTDAEDDNWDDEEEEAPAPKKAPAKKEKATKGADKKAAPAKKTSKKAAEDDDEDWDI